MFNGSRGGVCVSVRDLRDDRRVHYSQIGYASNPKPTVNHCLIIAALTHPFVTSGQLSHVTPEIVVANVSLVAQLTAGNGRKYSDTTYGRFHCYIDSESDGVQNCLKVAQFLRVIDILRDRSVQTVAKVLDNRYDHRVGPIQTALIVSGVDVCDAIGVMG
ncbi:unnamed protein product [Medioppia subpectinata]|uniref:Uncharacterized protein n=1 Tax=Medioppia subpectinata TaxID=1979941 RepID=A0A7R9LNF9_9ACAR|nr:unnamed protein product [Medioppia subpectinata]CAG2120241.1 unnamed protein product [Medioppia subpectinata]